MYMYTCMQASGASDLDIFHKYIHLYTNAISMQLLTITNNSHER